MQALTKYPIGSVRELFSISYPLMLSALSGSLIFFGDRLVVSFLAADALNALATAAMPCYIFMFLLLGIVGIAEVFVGQFNGRGEKSRLGEPVWQMLWLCIFSLVPYFVIGKYAAKILLPEQYYDLGKDYFFWYMLANSFYAMGVAICSFYIGQGYTRLVFWSVIFAAALNLILDVLLVFGVANVIPAFGVTGAGIATFLSQVAQLILLLYFFLSSDNRKNKGSGKYGFQRPLFVKCLKIGTPSALGHVIEIGAWTLLSHILADISVEHVTVFTIGQAFFVLFVFLTDGLNKGVVAVASNVLGASQYQYVSCIQSSAFKLLGIFAVIMFIPLVCWVDQVTGIFLLHETGSDLVVLKDYANTTLFWVWLFLIFDGISWIHNGLLTAAGDTFFIMVANTINLICFACIPIAVFIVYNHGPPSLTWKVVIAFVAANAITFVARCYVFPWKSKFLLVEVR